MHRACVCVCVSAQTSIHTKSYWPEVTGLIRNPSLSRNSKQNIAICLGCWGEDWQPWWPSLGLNRWENYIWFFAHVYSHTQRIFLLSLWSSKSKESFQILFNIVTWDRQILENNYCQNARTKQLHTWESMAHTACVQPAQLLSVPRVGGKNHCMADTWSHRG